MHKDTPAMALGAFVGAGIAIIFASCLAAAANHGWERKAIEHGAARYNPSTSKFEWLDEVEKASSEEH